MDRILAEYEAGIEDGLRDVSRAVLFHGNDIISKEAFDQGDLHASAEVKDLGTFEKAAAWTAEHAVHVNFPTGPAAGRPKYLPPLDAILEWVKRNVRVSTQPETRGEAVFKPTSKEGTRSATEAEHLEVAQAVRWNIYHEGTEGVHYMERAAARVRPDATRMVQEALRDRLQRL